MPSTSAAGNAQNPDMFVTMQRWGRCNFLFLQRSDKVLGFQSNSVKMKFQMRRRSYVRAANAIHKQQEHYSVLGLRRNASSTDIKKAYRRLARQYHPDVNKSPSASNSFQSVRLAYEVLSTDSLRAKYDTMLKLGELENRRAWINYPESDLNRQRREAWAETNQHAQTREKEDFYNYSESFSSSYEDHEDEEIIYDLWQRVVLVRIFSIIFVPKLFFPMSIIAGLLNRQMSAAYKFAHIVACFIGGSVGFFLLFALPFARRFYRTIYGKYSDNLLAGILFSIWVGTNVARVAPVPQGAILGFTYMSYKMQREVIKE